MIPAPGLLRRGFVADMLLMVSVTVISLLFLGCY